MMWTSIINNAPDPEEERWDPNPSSMSYGEWVEKVMQEPWVEALWSLVQWSGVWVGSEEQLVQELKLRVGKEVAASPDFPSTLERLMDYQGYAIDGFLSKGLGIFDYHEVLADGDLDDFDGYDWEPEPYCFVGGRRISTKEDLPNTDIRRWGPKSPVLVAEGNAAHRPHFWQVEFALLKYWHPLPVAILHLTVDRYRFINKHFPNCRRRMYTTKDLAKGLVNNLPSHRSIPYAALEAARPEGVDNNCPSFESREVFEAMTEPYGLKGHRIFHKQMKKWAPILKEARIKISWQRRRNPPELPEINDPERPLKTWWTIEAPRWKNPPRFRKGWAIYDDI